MISRRAFLVVFLTSLAVALFTALQQPGLTWFNIHQGRDLGRAFEWLDGSPTSLLGPELNHGHRLPGPSFYLVLAACWQLAGSITGTLTLLHLLTMTVLFTLRVVGTRLDRLSTLVFWLIFVLQPSHVLLSRTMWNPSLVLPVNLGYLLALHWYETRRDWRALAIFYLLGGIGIQFHLSLLLGLVAGTVWIWTLDRKLPRACLIGASCVALFWLAIWGATAGYEAYLKALRIEYAVPGGIDRPQKAFSLVNFLTSLRYHQFFYLNVLWDYEQYSVLLHYGKAYDPGAYQILEGFSALGHGFSLLVLVACLQLAYLTLRGRAEPLERLLVIWLFLGVAVLSFYRVKGGLFPYRYGMMFYPLFALAPAMSLNRLLAGLSAPGLRRATGYGALAFATLAFSGNAYVLKQVSRIAAASGRVSHSGDVDSEMALKYKLDVLRQVDLSDSPEAFMHTMHGGVANRIRNFEFEDWIQRHWMGGLGQALRRSEGPLQPEPGHQALRFREPQQWSQSPDPESFPLERTFLATSDLPEDIVVTYLDAAGTELARRTFARGEAILATREAPRRCKNLLVTFRVQEGDSPWLAIWFDNKLPNGTMRLTSASVNGRSLPTAAAREGIWLDQALVRLEVGQQAASCELRFRVFVLGTYSRLDIFRE